MKTEEKTLDPLNDGVSELELIDSAGCDLSVVRAARVSTARDGREEGARRLIRFLVREGHFSPFEHTFLTFRAKAPLFVVGQWHRHRVGWSYNQQSRRYTSDGLEFYAPSEWRRQNQGGNRQTSGEAFGEGDSELLQSLAIGAARDSERLYNAMLDAGAAREMARMVLPQSLYSSFYATCNLRSLRHFLTLRQASDAQQEIRAYADGMRQLAEPLFPLSFAAFDEFSDGSRA